MGAMIWKFWWESKPNSKSFLALKALKEVCKPKALGGLGFHRFYDMNFALMSKLSRKIAIGMKPFGLTFS